MRHLIPLFAICMALVWHAPEPVSALTSKELCDRVYQQYGLRSEGCGPEQVDTIDNPVAATPAAARRSGQDRPDQEMQENHVFFAAGGATLDPSALAQLAVLSDVLNAPLMQDACLRLVGHSDSSGSTARNQEIGLQRAEAVAAVLRQGLQDGTRVREVLSLGEARALAGFAPESRYNRRVEIFAKTCD